MATMGTAWGADVWTDLVWADGVWTGDTPLTVLFGLNGVRGGVGRFRRPASAQE